MRCEGLSLTNQATHLPSAWLRSICPPLLDDSGMSHQRIHPSPSRFFPNNETPRGKKERKKERRNQERSEPGSDAKRGKKDSRSVRKAE